MTAVVAAIGLACAGAPPAGAATRDAANPKAWDPRVAGIAKTVERLRGLKFEHPVPVRFLSDAEFVAAQQKDAARDMAGQKADLERTQNILRALGLVDRGVDLVKVTNDLQSSDVLAYYDPETKRVTVRGSQATDVATRVTLAHELTHVLQDQHFDLDRIGRAATKSHSDTVSRALLEGDAIRVQNLYEQELSSADQAAYDAVSKTQTEHAKASIAEHQIPDAVVAVFEAPYDFGPSMVTVAVGKVNGGVNALLRNPPTTESAFLTPSTLVDRPPAVRVPVPALASGERRVGHADVFGAYGLYLVLSSRLGPADALQVADQWGGDSMVTFTREAASGTQPCLRAAFAGRSNDATDAIRAGLTTWSAAMPPGATSVATQDGRVVLTACDTGAAPPAGAHAASDAETFAAARDALYAAIVKDGNPSAQAVCAADRLVRDPVFAPVLADPNATPTASQLSDIQTRAQAIGQECRPSR